LYDDGSNGGDNRSTHARVGGQWRQRLGELRLEWAGGTGAYRAASHSLRLERLAGQAAPLRTLQDDSISRETSANLTLKASALAGDGAAGAEHSLVGGGEVEGVRRNDTRTALQNGAPLLADFGDEVQASSLRAAGYLQDEWAPSASWSAQAGLRWEGITTRGDSGDGTHPGNRSSVWTPLLHAVWKPDPKRRDQLRVSLTRSYRSPTLSSLIARPSINRDYAPGGPNTPVAPDSAGNAGLRPELARGIDVALERYLDGGGVLSANVFQRQISNLMRGVTALETVSWSPVPRWVRRQQNIGDAVTSGIELEAKFRLDQVLDGAVPVELRGNLAFFGSRVKSVPGPDNRLDQQARATANLGADYRLRGLPLTLGGNFNWVPGTVTRLDVGQYARVSTKSQWDAYALWTLDTATALRLLGSNLAPRDYASTTIDDAPGVAGTERTTARSNGPSYLNWQLRLELKL
jgi:iron complex outermembrane receptor protein